MARHEFVKKENETQIATTVAAISKIEQKFHFLSFFSSTDDALSLSLSPSIKSFESEPNF